MHSFIVEPEVAGGWGPHMKADTSTHPPSVSHLHHVFEDWLGDELVWSFPCFMVTTSLAGILAPYSGFSLASPEVSFSPDFVLAPLDGRSEMPTWLWFKVHGESEADDLWLEASGRLIVSERAMDALRPFLRVANVAPYSSAT